MTEYASEKYKADRREKMRAIVRAVAMSHDLTEADIYVSDRTQNIAAARFAVWRELVLFGFRVSEICALARWDFSAVKHGIDQVEKIARAAE